MSESEQKDLEQETSEPEQDSSTDSSSQAQTKIDDDDEVKADQVEADKVEVDKVEADKVEADKVEADKVEADKVEADKVKADKVKADKVKADKVEADKVKADKVKADKVKADKVKADKVKAGETEETAEEADEADEAEPPVEKTAEQIARENPLAPDGQEKKWYVVHTYSGYENKARKTLEERIGREKLSDFFGQLLVPTEEVVEMKRGKRRTSKRKFFPGYMLVQMAMNEATWYLVKSTPKITGFVGDSTNPPPVPEVEISRLTMQLTEGAERVIPKIIFEKGDSVRVMDGPFANFNGVVEEVDQEKGKLRVLVSIFGRATPVEMDFVQVERT
ncbi:MAG: transcription termination/antitermination protein NusG [Deltaproteobacteria bacterium]|nr:transcription termination/antitermination protein NusG [Deltaproteobacteria bacterium]